MENGVQTLDEAVSISHSTNTLGKGINQTIPYPAISKLTGLFNLGKATNLEKGILNVILLNLA